MRVVIILSFFTLMLFSPDVKAEIKATVSDTTVVRLMNTFQFRKAVNVLGVKLENSNRKDFDRQLYYNNQLSMAYLRLGLIDSAMICSRKSIYLSSMSLDSSIICDAWKVTSYAYNRDGKLDSAIIYTQIMADYAERHADKRVMRNSMTSLGTIMNQNQKFREALKYFKKSYLLTEELKDSLSYSSMNYNLGLTYLNLSNPDSSILYLKEALRYSLNDKHFELAAFIYTTTADAYLQLGDLKKWKENAINVYKTAEKIKNYRLMAQAYGCLLLGYSQNKNYQEAIQYGNKALDLLKEYRFPSLQVEIDSIMYVAYKSIGNFKIALSFLETYSKQKSILLSEDQKKQLDEIQTRFDVKEKDLLIARQKLELSQKQKNIQLLIFLILIFALVVIASIIYVVRNHRFRRELYKKEKYLDKQLSDTKLWMEGVFLSDSFIPTTLKNLPHEGETSPNAQDILTPQSILYSDLREMIEKQKLYLNPELNLQMVIKLLGTNKKYLYDAISSNTDNNFRNFINRYRINHAKKIIEENISLKSNINLSELYHISGFNNTTSFFRTFKAITGLTPKEYSIEVLNDINEEKLRDSI